LIVKGKNGIGCQGKEESVGYLRGKELVMVVEGKER